MADNNLDSQNFKDVLSLSNQLLDSLTAVQKVEQNINSITGRNLNHYKGMKDSIDAANKSLKTQTDSLEKLKKIELDRRQTNKLNTELANDLNKLKQVNVDLENRISALKTVEISQAEQLVQKHGAQLGFLRHYLENEKRLLYYVMQKGEITEAELEARSAALNWLKDEVKFEENKFDKAQEILNVKLKELGLASHAKDLNDEIIVGLEMEQEITQHVADNFGKIKNALGLSKGIISAINSIPLSKSFFDADKALAQINANALNTKKGFMGIVAGVGAGFKNLSTLLESITSFAALKTVFTWIKDTIFLIDENVSKIAKGFNITYTEADKVRKNLDGIKLAAGDANVNFKTLSESMLVAGQAMGTNVALSNENLVTFTKMREAAGFTNEELLKLNEYSLAGNKTLEETTGEFIAQAKITALNNKVVLNEKQLLKEIGTVSNSIKINFRGSAAELGKAMAHAKAMGLSLETIEKTASSLLNFESSIENELEAELLTGKQLNLERARYFALTNQTDKLMDEITNNLVTQSEYENMNRLARESYAASLGMSVDDLSTMYLKQSALKNLTGQQAESASQMLDSLISQVGVEEAQNRLKKDGLDTLMNQQGINERFEKTMYSIKETLSSIVAGPFLTMVDMLASMLKNANNLKIVFDTIGAIIGTRVVLGLTGAVSKTAQLLVTQGILSASAAAWASAITLGLGTAAIIAGLYVMNSKIDEATAKAQAQAEQQINATNSITPKVALAEGGIVSKRIDNATIGEAGPEAVIPLNSPKAKGIMGDNSNDRLTASVEELVKILRNPKEIVIQNNLSIDSQKFFLEASKHTVQLNA